MPAPRWVATALGPVECIDHGQGRALLETLGVRHATVAAMSAGGPSALHLAARRPNICRGLVLVSAVTGRLVTPAATLERMRMMAALEQRQPDWNSLADVALEPIQREAGVFEATLPFLRDVRSLTRDMGLLLILDEIQTGVGRIRRMFGFEHARVMPDIMTLGKGLGGGVPLAALLAHRDVACFDYGDQGGTFCGNPMTAAAGCAVLGEITKPDFLARVQQAGARLTQGLRAISVRHGCGAVRGLGLLLALYLRRDISARVVALALQHGLLINGPRPDSLRFMPALTVRDDEIDAMLGILDGVLGEISASIALVSCSAPSWARCRAPLIGGRRHHYLPPSTITVNPRRGRRWCADHEEVIFASIHRI